MATTRTRRASAKAAVKPMQLYIGSIDYCTVRDQMRLRRVLDRALERVAKDNPDASRGQIWVEVEQEARRRGIIRPAPGQHF